MKGLALDGGGVFGVGQASILSQVKDLDKFDFVAGTSVGAIVGASIATKIDQAQFMDFFLEKAPKIFAGYTWKRFNPFTPRYSDKELNAALKSLFPGKLKDVKVPLFITAADLNRETLKVFFSGDSEDGELWLWEVVRMAVAAEGYFLPWKGLADGGPFANNPAMVATVGSIAKLGVSLSELELCSIGTGERCKNNTVGSTKWWTVLKWGRFILSILLSGAANKMHEYFVTNLPLKKHLRIQFERKKGWAMDNAALIPKALEEWDHLIFDAIVKVDRF